MLSLFNVVWNSTNTAVIQVQFERSLTFTLVYLCQLKYVLYLHYKKVERYRFYSIIKNIKILTINKMDKKTVRERICPRGTQRRSSALLRTESGGTVDSNAWEPQLVLERLSIWMPGLRISLQGCRNFPRVFSNGLRRRAPEGLFWNRRHNKAFFPEKPGAIHNGKDWSAGGAYSGTPVW